MILWCYRTCVRSRAYKACVGSIKYFSLIKSKQVDYLTIVSNQRVIIGSIFGACTRFRWIDEYVLAQSSRWCVCIWYQCIWSMHMVYGACAYGINISEHGVHTGCNLSLVWKMFCVRIHYPRVPFHMIPTGQQSVWDCVLNTRVATISLQPQTEDFVTALTLDFPSRINPLVFSSAHRYLNLWGFHSFGTLRRAPGIAFTRCMHLGQLSPQSLGFWFIRSTK